MFDKCYCGAYIELNEYVCIECTLKEIADNEAYEKYLRDLFEEEEKADE